MSTAATIAHKFVSGKADGPDPTFVQPSKWNQNLNLGGGVNGELVVRDTGQTDGLGTIPIPVYGQATLTNRTGGTQAVGDVVATSAADDTSVILGDTSGSLQRYVVALGTNADTVAGAYVTQGLIAGVKAQGSIARGQYVRKSATTLKVEDAGVAVGTATAAPAGALGIALTTAAAGVVTVLWFAATASSAATGVNPISNQVFGG